MSALTLNQRRWQGRFIDFFHDKMGLVQAFAKVTGLLTVRGVSKPVTLDVTLNQSGINPISDNKTVGFTAITDIKRSDFGIKTLLPGLGDDVKMNIEAEAYQPKE